MSKDFTVPDWYFDEDEYNQIFRYEEEEEEKDEYEYEYEDEYLNKIGDI